MSFGLPPLKNKPVVNPDDCSMQGGNIYGLPNPMVAGLGATRPKVGFAHPLEASERNFHKNRLQREMVMLRNIQGLHAPMRLAMELKTADKVGRLPFLHSSKVMRDVILGRDEEIGFEDILNTHEFREQMGQPHAIVEKQLGIL
ncbi:proteasome maturation protein [Venturia canescens]|uniref:proteasome maturation protein n=1 Tax=Venturia canescens TaxID=32260 RepID=UPI001C9D45BE|nr:proteasome maturation protein [Venturia canescens]